MIEFPFVTPIYSNQITGPQLNNVQLELEELVNKTEFRYNDEWKSHYIGGDFESTFEFKHFQNVLEENIPVFCNEIGYQMPEYKIKSWFSMFKKNNYGHKHDHGTADMSGVYYYKTNGNDGDIKFYTPAIQTNSSIFKHFCGRPFAHKPSVGKLLLFPGYLLHSIDTNLSNDERISLSFNIYFNKF